MAGVSTKVAIMLLLVAVAYAAPNGSRACKGVSCPTSYMPGNALLPDPRNPCIYCQCVWGEPIPMKCARGQGWNVMYSQCMPNPNC